MTTIQTIPGAVRKLTAGERRSERAWIIATLEEAKRRAGMPDVTFRVEWNARFTRRLGDSLVVDRPGKVGRLRFSATALYLRATAQEREALVYHEAAHSLADIKHGKRCKHGPLWKAMMRTLGQTPDRCHNVDRTGLKRGQRQRYPVPVVRIPGPAIVVRVRVQEPAPAPVHQSHAHLIDTLVSWSTDQGQVIGRVLEIDGQGFARIFVIGDHLRAIHGRFARVQAAACSPA